MAIFFWLPVLAAFGGYFTRQRAVTRVACAIYAAAMGAVCLAGGVSQVLAFVRHQMPAGQTGKWLGLGAVALALAAGLLYSALSLFVRSRGAARAGAVSLAALGAFLLSIQRWNPARPGASALAVLNGLAPLALSIILFQRGREEELSLPSFPN